MRILEKINWWYLLLSPPDDVLSKKADLCNFSKILRIKVKLKVTFKRHLFKGSNSITFWFNMVFTQWFNLGLSMSVVQQLLLISHFVTKVPFVALKLILSHSLCMITWFKLVLSKISCKFCFIDMCALFCHFSGSIFTKKDII